MTKKERMDDCVGDGDENGMVERKELNRRQVDSSINRIVSSPGLRTPTSIKYDSVLQKLVKAGLEWIKPVQDELAENAVAVRQEMKQMQGVPKYHLNILIFIGPLFPYWGIMGTCIYR